jgi:hypothetical protein
MANALSVPTVEGARISFVQPFRQRQFASPSLVSHHPCGRLHCINHNHNSVCEAKNDAKSENIIFPNKSSAVFSHKLKFNNNMHLRRALLDGAVGASKARTAGAAEVVADAVV